MGLAELISGKCSFIEPCWESENNQPLKKKKKKVEVQVFRSRQGEAGRTGNDKH